MGLQTGLTNCTDLLNTDLKAFCVSFSPSQMGNSLTTISYLAHQVNSQGERRVSHQRLSW